MENKNEKATKRTCWVHPGSLVVDITAQTAYEALIQVQMIVEAINHEDAIRKVCPDIKITIKP
jgi:hypothetical protein